MNAAYRDQSIKVTVYFAPHGDGGRMSGQSTGAD
jgi:hypothetical protein